MNEVKTKHGRKWLYTAIGLLLVVALLATMFPATALAEEKPEKVECKATYRIKTGDTLVKIATKFNIYVKAIIAANNMASPYTIYVGNSLCIPAKNVKDSAVPKHANKVAADFTTYVKDKNLYITTTNFPQDTIFYVKVKGDKAPGTVQSKIGLLNTSSRSNFTEVFKLPKNYQTSNQLKVCLKNVYTNALVCRTALKK
jgi:LysM repeat protein